MQSGATVETATIGRCGVIGENAGLGARCTCGRAIVRLPGTAAWLSSTQFHAAANQSQAIRDLIVRYNDLLLAQVQQSVACNALHALEARLCRWLLQAHDCVAGGMIPLTQEFLGQMLGVRRTTVTIAAKLLQSAGLIRYRRGYIQIVDRAALEDISCECYAVAGTSPIRCSQLLVPKRALRSQQGGPAEPCRSVGLHAGGATPPQPAWTVRPWHPPRMP